MAITASRNIVTGALTIFGDDLGNAILVSRNAAGQIFVNGGAVPIAGGVPTVANTVLIQVFAAGGFDGVIVDELNGPLPRAELFGGAGSDSLTGGAGAHVLNGEGGDDVLNGLGGADTLFGGGQNDSLLGGAGDDQVFGEDGDDRLVWSLGDGSDLFEGGAGADTVEVSGGNGAETFTVTANGARVRLDGTGPAPFSLDIGTTETLAVNMGGGANVFDAGDGLAALIRLFVSGGAGSDTIESGGGNDTLAGGGGNDAFRWDSGDGSDTVEGGSGVDTLELNGSGAGERIDLSANGGRARLVRNVDGVTMDLNDLEEIELQALGGADAITVGHLGGTALGELNIELAGVPGGSGGDGQADAVLVKGSGAADSITVGHEATSAVVLGLPALISVNNADAIDRLRVEGGAGDDTIATNAGFVVTTPGIIRLTLDGGAGNDTISGDKGHDMLIGGAGVDLLDGKLGNDRFFVDDALDSVADSGGVDRVFASVSYALGTSAIETLSTASNAGTAAIDLTGNAVANTIFGNAGQNVINGGFGADRLFGLGGEDTFLFDTAITGGPNIDRVGDFAVADDTIALDRNVFAGLSEGVLAADAFHIGAAAADAEDRIVYNQATGRLIYDDNGSAAGGATLFAVLGTGLALTNLDFVVE